MPDTGPFLRVAAFCSDVIEGKDGVLSLIRIIDRLTIAAGGAKAPADMPPVPHRLKLVLMLISGRARGTHEITVKLVPPDPNDAKDWWTGTVFLEGEDRGANVVVDAEVTFGQQGLYWFQVYFGDTLMTSMPFRVIYQRAGGGMALQ